MRSLLTILVLSIAGPALAGIRTRVSNVGNAQVLLIEDTSKTNDLNIIEGAAANGSPSVTIPLDRAWEKLRVFTFATYSASTYVTISVSCSLDGTNYGVIQTRALASGTATLSDLSDCKALGAADKGFMTEYDVRGCMDVKLTVGSDDADLVDLQAVAVR